jgi:hypothetical protein
VERQRPQADQKIAGKGDEKDRVVTLMYAVEDAFDAEQDKEPVG